MPTGLTSPRAMSTVHRTARRLDTVLGRVVYGLAGIVVGGLTLGLAAALWSAVEARQFGAASVLGPVVLAGTALTAYCFSPRRRLSDLD